MLRKYSKSGSAQQKINHFSCDSGFILMNKICSLFGKINYFILRAKYQIVKNGLNHITPESNLNFYLITL